MKKLSAFLLLLCAVSCTQTKPKPAFQESLPPIPTSGLLPNNSPTKASPASPAEEQFNPARTNTVAVTPADDRTPTARSATNAPMLSVTNAVSPVTTPEELIPAGTIDFTGADLKEVLKIYTGLVNRTILQPAGLPNPQIVLRTQTALTKRELIQAMEAVFSLNGISLVNVGDKFVKVLTAADAHTAGAINDTRSAGDLPDLGQYVTHVAQLKYTKPSEMVPALQPFAKLNSLLPMDGSMILIIRDYTENVKRMLEMIDQIDVNVPSEFISEVIPIKYAKASEMADALNSLGASAGGGGTVGARSSSTRGAATRGGGGGGGIGGGLNRPGGIGGASQYGGGITPGGGAAAGQPASFTDRLSRLISKASSSGDLQLFGQMKMIADERSNSLLIFATRSDMEMIKSVIAKLDVVLAQVLIETAILDVNISRDFHFGVTAGQVPKTNSIGSIGGVINNSGNPLGTLASFLGNQFVSNSTSSFPVGDGLNYFGRYNGNVDVAVNALASNGRGNVVQRPQILTTHATPGSIFVGDTVPYITSTFQGGQFGGQSSYQQLQVGISLTVTPYINQDGLVVMQIDETIDGLNGTTKIDGNDVPKTTSRKLSAEVAVRDGETIILGGFIKNSSDKSISGVPFLKDIPLLGVLFTSRSDKKERSELIVLMRPTVLKTPEIAAIHTTKMKKQLPGVLRAEAELVTEERKQLEEDAQVVRDEEKKAARAKSKKAAAAPNYDDSKAPQ